MAGIVDEVCPGGASSHLTHGQVIKVLVANRLTSPAPLVRVRDWARTWAVEDLRHHTGRAQRRPPGPRPGRDRPPAWRSSRAPSALGRSPSSVSTSPGCTGT
ncbi:DUF4277 domain-containing protein [Streptomyces spororaveus]|uniref:DUF4277 domain-containing protein n=1 Tax=Streptomyces spororaveus TaxID=284039 RepID=UPI0036B082E7